MSSSVTDAATAGSINVARSATRPPSEWPTSASGVTRPRVRTVASTSPARVVESAPRGSGGEAP